MKIRGSKLRGAGRVATTGHPQIEFSLGALKGEAGAPCPPVSRQKGVRGASRAREGVRGLPQYEKGTHRLNFD